MHVKVWEQADRAFTTSSAQPNAKPNPKARVALGLDGPSNPPRETEQLGLGNEVFRRSLSDPKMQSSLRTMVSRSVVPSEPKPHPKPTKSELLGLSPTMASFGNLVVLMCDQGAETTWLVLNLTLFVSNHPEGLINRVVKSRPRFSDF